MVLEKSAYVVRADSGGNAYPCYGGSLRCVGRSRVRGGSRVRRQSRLGGAMRIHAMGGRFTVLARAAIVGGAACVVRADSEEQCVSMPWAVATLCWQESRSLGEPGSGASRVRLESRLRRSVCIHTWPLDKRPGLAVSWEDVDVVAGMRSSQPLESNLSAMACRGRVSIVVMAGVSCASAFPVCE